MKALTEHEYEALKKETRDMCFRLGSQEDAWYPTIEEIDTHITEYTKDDIKFLMWCLNPVMELNAEQLKTRRHILSILYDQEKVPVVFEDMD